MGKVRKRCGLQFVLVAEMFGLKTIFRPFISRRQIRARPNENYYRKTLLFGVKVSKIKGEAKDCFPFVSSLVVGCPRSLFRLGIAGNQLLF
jgi:hypothetical protein